MVLVRFSDARNISAATTCAGKGRPHEKLDCLIATITEDGLSIFYREAGRKTRRHFSAEWTSGSPGCSILYSPAADTLTTLSRRIIRLRDTEIWPYPKKFAYTLESHRRKFMNPFTEVRASSYRFTWQDLRRGCFFFFFFPRGSGVFAWLAHPGPASRRSLSRTLGAQRGLGPRIGKNTPGLFRTDRDATMGGGCVRANLLHSRGRRGPRHVGSDPNGERYAPALWPDGICLSSQPGQGVFKATLLDYRHERRLLNQVAGMERERTTAAAGDLGQVGTPHSELSGRRRLYRRD